MHRFPQDSCSQPDVGPLIHVNAKFYFLFSSLGTKFLNGRREVQIDSHHPVSTSIARYYYSPTILLKRWVLFQPFDRVALNSLIHKTLFWNILIQLLKRWGKSVSPSRVLKDFASSVFDLPNEKYLSAKDLKPRHRHSECVTVINSLLLVSIPDTGDSGTWHASAGNRLGRLFSRSMVQEPNVLVVRKSCNSLRQVQCREILLAYDAFVSPLRVA